jgi:phosphatidylinositol glycan class B
MDSIIALTCSTMVDYYFSGKLYFALWNFIRVNMYISAVFGATSPIYHLTSTLPIFLSPIWYWWGQGFISCLLPRRYVPAMLKSLDAPEGMRALARGIAFAIFILSFSPHSEWRFLHPFLPSLLLFALPPLFKGYTPTIMGAYLFRDSIRQYVRFPKRAFYLIMLAPIPIYILLNGVQDWPQVKVMSVLRRGEIGEVTGVAIVIACYSTPWQSHLHRDVPSWRLGCEPPVDRK